MDTLSGNERKSGEEKAVRPGGGGGKEKVRNHGRNLGGFIFLRFASHGICEERGEKSSTLPSCPAVWRWLASARMEGRDSGASYPYRAVRDLDRRGAPWWG